VNTNYLYYCC